MSTEVLRSREENQSSLAILNMVTSPPVLFLWVFSKQLISGFGRADLHVIQATKEAEVGGFQAGDLPGVYSEFKATHQTSILVWAYHCR